MLALILALSLMSRANADVNLREGCAVRFASVNESAEILGRKDDFIQRLSAFDRAARMKTERSISEDEFLKFVKENVLTWNEWEKAKIEAAICKHPPGTGCASVVAPENYQSREDNRRRGGSLVLNARYSDCNAGKRDR